MSRRLIPIAYHKAERHARLPDRHAQVEYIVAMLMTLICTVVTVGTGLLAVVVVMLCRMSVPVPVMSVSLMVLFEMPVVALPVHLYAR